VKIENRKSFKVIEKEKKIPQIPFHASWVFADIKIWSFFFQREREKKRKTQIFSSSDIKKTLHQDSLTFLNRKSFAINYLTTKIPAQTVAEYKQLVVRLRLQGLIIIIHLNRSLRDCLSQSVTAGDYTRLWICQTYLGVISLRGWERVIWSRNQVSYMIRNGWNEMGDRNREILSVSFRRFVLTREFSQWVSVMTDSWLLGHDQGSFIYLENSSIYILFYLFGIYCLYFGSCFFRATPSECFTQNCFYVFVCCALCFCTLCMICVLRLAHVYPGSHLTNWEGKQWHNYVPRSRHFAGEPLMISVSWRLSDHFDFTRKQTWMTAVCSDLDLESFLIWE